MGNEKCKIGPLSNFIGKNKRKKKFFKKLKVEEIKCWDTSTSSQVSNCDGVVLEIYFNYKLQWPQEGLKCKSLEYKVVT